MDLETILDENADQYEADRIALERLYQDAFDKMTTFGISLIDNQDFLETFLIPGADLSFLDFAFSSEEGAVIETLEDLRFALDEVFFARVDFGLEELATADIPPSTASCSDETRDTARDILE